MALHFQNDQSPTQKPQLVVTLGGFGGGGCANTDLSLATPGFTNFKSTERQRPKRFWEENPTKIIMSRFNRNVPRLELKLNLSPTRDVGPDSPARPIGSVSPPSSCVSSEVSQVDEVEQATATMVVVGCPRCLMYVMMPEEVDNKCPRCKSHVLLDVVNEPVAAGAANGMAAPSAVRGGAKRVRKS